MKLQDYNRIQTALFRELRVVELNEIDPDKFLKICKLVSIIRVQDNLQEAKNKARQIIEKELKTGNDKNKTA